MSRSSGSEKHVQPSLFAAQVPERHVELRVPIPSARVVIRSVDCVLIFLQTDEGAVGEGMIFTLNGLRLSTVHEMVRSFEPLVLSVEPALTGYATR